MKNVIIRPNEHGGLAIIIDGTDVSGWVLRDGVVIELRAGVAYLTLPVAPAVLSALLPEGVVNALSVPDSVAIRREVLQQWVDALEKERTATGLLDATWEVLAEMRRVVES